MNNEFSCPVVQGFVIVTSHFKPPDRPNHLGIDLAPRPKGNPAITAFHSGTIILLQENHATAGNWLEIWDGEITTTGVQAALTRKEHENPSLDVRGGLAKGYDLFISQHSNAATGSARGTECFYSVKQPQNKAIAMRFASEIAQLFGHSNRGAKIREGDYGADYYGVIRSAVSAACSHVYLCESGFHDNVLDEAFLFTSYALKHTKADLKPSE